MKTHSLHGCDISCIIAGQNVSALHQAEKERQGALGDQLVLIYLAQDAGLWLGGWWVMRLARGGRSVLAARRRVIAGAYAIAMAIMILPLTRSLALTTRLICAYVFALGCWSANMGAFKQEVSARRVGTVAALVGFLETGFAAFVIDRIGTLAKNTGGFGAVFPLLAGFLTFSAAVVYWFFRPRHFPLSVGGPDSTGAPPELKHGTGVAAPRAPAQDN